jgi:hypothetical protein
MAQIFADGPADRSYAGRQALSQAGHLIAPARAGDLVVSA